MRSTILALAVLLEIPSGLGAQEADPPAYTSLVESAQEAGEEALLTDSSDERRRLGIESQQLAEEALALRPGGVEARYLHAAALGIRLETEGATTKIRLAREMWDEAGAVLALDSLHAGAIHLQGRLHAGIMRLGRLTRFLARQLVGGELLDTASWEEAEIRLARAVELDPDNPMNRLELGVLYRDTDRPDLAEATFVEVLSIEARSPLDEQVRARAKTLLDELDRGVR